MSNESQAATETPDDWVGIGIVYNPPPADIDGIHDALMRIASADPKPNIDIAPEYAADLTTVMQGVTPMIEELRYRRLSDPAPPAR